MGVKIRDLKKIEVDKEINIYFNNEIIGELRRALLVLILNFKQ